MRYIDFKYVRLLSSYVRNFKVRNSNLVNFSCPICGDSVKNKNKARGFFIEKDRGYYYHCHNCKISLSLGSFLKRVVPALYDEYIFEKYKSIKETQEVVAKKIEPVLKEMKSNLAQRLDTLDDAHYCKQYVKARLIPEDKFNLLYFTADFAKLAEDLFPGRYKELKENDSRLVLPFFNKEGKVIGLQGRALNGDDKLRYATIRADEHTALLYGLERLDLSKRVYIVEGPIDSLFLPNSIAAATSDLERVVKIMNIPDYVLVFDNEPRNKEVMKVMEKAINNDRRVCIWPDSIEEKDINDMVKSGMEPAKILDLIDHNLYNGLKAKLVFNNWKRC